MNSTKNNETLSEGIGKIINNPRQPLPFPLTNKIEFLQKKNYVKKLKKYNKHNSSNYFPLFIFILITFIVSLIFYLEYNNRIKHFYHNIIPLKEAFD